MGKSLRSVLATSDLTDGSDPALETAAALAEDPSTRLHVFYCVAEPTRPYWKGAIEHETKRKLLRESRVELHGRLRHATGDDATHAEVAVGIGTPARAIARFAERVSADVIVLGRHEPRRALDDLLGTTADRVLRVTDRPCLIAHRALKRPIRRILVATDFSAHARRASETIIDWLADGIASARHDAREHTVVEFLHVYAFGSPLYRPFAAEPFLQDEIDAAHRRLPGDSPVTMRFRTVSARAAVDGIAATADELDPDLVVIGTHGYGVLPRALLGSVASSVVRTIPQPVLVVPLHGSTPPTQ